MEIVSTLHAERFTDISRDIREIPAEHGWLAGICGEWHNSDKGCRHGCHKEGRDVDIAAKGAGDVGISCASLCSFSCSC